MKNRQKDEILRDVLTVCNGGSSITKVMFHAYITHGQARTYLQQLIDNGLVEYDSFDRIYHATAKGLDYLKAVETMAELFSVTTKRTVRQWADSPFPLAY